MEKPDKIIERSGLFILSFQLEGLCSALRLALQTAQPHGPASVAILKKLREDMSHVLLGGKTVERMPEISESVNTVDLIAIAETLRFSLMAFLTPTELEDQSAAFGFNRK